jgi:hypothetical protein
MLVDFDYLRAQTGVVYMHDLDLAFEKFVGKKLGFERQNLPDWKLPIAHQQDAAVTHVDNQAGKPGVPGIQ